MHGLEAAERGEQRVRRPVGFDLRADSLLVGERGRLALRGVVLVLGLGAGEANVFRLDKS